MKHLFSRVLFLLAAPFLTAVAWAQPTVSVNVAGNAITGTGTAVVNLIPAGLHENTVTFTLTWDPAVLSYVSDVAGSAIPTDGSATITRNKTQTAAGKLGMLIGLEPGTEFSAGTKQLLTVTFAVVGAGAANTSVAFVDFATVFPKKKVFDKDGGTITTATFNDATIAANSLPAAPTITTPPASQTVTSGSNATFAVVANGSPAPSIKWQKDTVDLVNGGRVSGATTATLSITGALSTDAGSYRAVATNASGTVTSTAATLTVDKAPQTITFGALSDVTFPASPITLTATASSGLAVSYVSSNTAVATVSGNTVTVIGAGTTTITANQAGNSEFLAAPAFPRTLTVGQASQTITFGALSAKTFGDSTFTLAATASSGLAVIYASSDVNVATVSGSTVTIVGAGTAIITASQTGNTNFAAATPVPQSLTVNKKSQTITFGTLGQKEFNAAPFALAATVNSPLGVTYSSSNTAVATVSGSTVTIVGVGTTTITASQAGNANFGPALNVTQILTVNKATATVVLGGLSATFDGTAKTATATTTPTGLTVSLTYAGGTTAPIGAGTYAVIATVDDVNFAGTATGNLVIAKAPQTITFGALTAKTFNDPSFDLAATTTSPLAVTYASANTGVATISGNTVTIVGAGSTVITASQVGDGNFLAATPVPQTLTVNKAAATVTLGNLAAVFNSGTPRAATAVTAPVGLTVTFTYDGNATAPTNAGTYAVVGTINNANYAGTASGNLVIAKAPQVITFNALPSKALDEVSFVLAGASNSGLPLSYVSSATSVATIGGANGTTVTLVNTGTTTITASQAGNTNYLPATDVPQVLTVLSASQTITFLGTELAGKTFGDPSFTLTATTNRSLTVSFISSNPSVATVSGNTVTITGAGTTTITAQQVGNSNFAAAPDVARTLTVAKKATTATLNNLAQVYDTAPKPVTATTTPAGLMVTFTYAGNITPPTNAGSYAVVGTIDDINYSGTVSGTLVISKAAQTITFAALPSKILNAGPFALAATSSSGLAVSYTSSTPAVASVTGNTVTLVSIGNTTITASQVGDSNYNAASNVTQTLTVNPIAPIIVSTPPLAASAVQGRAFLFGPITINNTPATFSATGLPAGLTVNTSLGTISGAPTAIPTPNPASIVLTATNVTGSDSRTITLTVQAPPPVITSAAATSGRVGTAFTFAVVATNTPTSYAATNLPAGLVIDPGTGAISGTPTSAGTSTVQLTVTNAAGSVSQPLVIAIEPPLNAPVYTGPLSPSGTQGVAFSFTPAFGTVTAPYALTGTLPSGLTFTAATGIIAGTPTQTGQFFVTLSATNAGGTTTVNLSLTINAAPAAPVITSSSIAPGARVGTAFTFQLTSTGTPAASSYTVLNLPAGLSLVAATGAISGTPTAFGSFDVNVSATNTVGTGPTSVLTISVAPSASAPVINSSPIIAGQVNVAFSGVTLTASPAATIFAVTSGTLPAGLALTPATGAITGTPLAAAAGQTRVWFAGTNASGTGLALEVLFSIAPAAATPVVNSNGTATAQVGQPFQYVITATNGPITAFAAAGRPSWLSLDATTGVLSGVPTESTTTPLALLLTATNAGGTGSPKTLSLSVAPAPATPVVTSTLTASGRVGTAFTYQITGSETPTSYVATGLPAGLVLNAATGAITGSPTVANSFNVVLSAANAGGLGAPSTLVIDVAPAVAAPAITSASSAAAQVGAAFSYQIVATNGPILSYSADLKALPTGLSVNTATGVISGTPAADPRTYLVTLTATNAGGTSLPQVLSIIVAPALGVPVVTTPLYVVGTVGVDFSLTITATNLTGSAPYAPPINLEAVGLPAGLAVNPATGVIAGKPTAVGTTVATLVATNASGTGPTRDLTIFVLPAPTAPVVGGAAVAVGQVNEPFTYQIVASNSPTSYEVLNSPVWITLNPVTGAVSGVPTTPGTFTVQLTASNTAGTSNPAILGLFISPAANTPVITSTRTATGTVGTSFTYTPVAAPAATGYVASGLPGGLGLNATSGAISGTPNVSGTFNVILTPSNANGIGAPVTIVITILPNVTFGS